MIHPNVILLSYSGFVILMSGLNMFKLQVVSELFTSNLLSCTSWSWELVFTPLNCSALCQSLTPILMWAVFQHSYLDSYGI